VWASVLFTILIWSAGAAIQMVWWTKAHKKQRILDKLSDEGYDSRMDANVNVATGVQRERVVNFDEQNVTNYHPNLTCTVVNASMTGIDNSLVYNPRESSIVDPRPD
jgi:hypothetical protein